MTAERTHDVRRLSIRVALTATGLVAIAYLIVSLAVVAQDKGGALRVKLARAPCARAQRWAHLLSGSVDLGSLPSQPPGDDIVAASEMAAMKARLSSVEAEIDRLRGLVERLCADLDVQS